MTQRERLVVELLRNLSYAVGTSAGASNSHGATGDRVALQAHEPTKRDKHGKVVGGCRFLTDASQPCSCWIASVTELKRCLRELYKAERRLFWQVYERYIVCDRRPRTVIVKAGKRRVEHFDGDCFEVLTLLPRGNGVTRALVETWRGDVQPELVSAGVAWIAGAFRGSPQLPNEWRIEENAA